MKDFFSKILKCIAISAFAMAAADLVVAFKKQPENNLVFYTLFVLLLIAGYGIGSSNAQVHKGWIILSLVLGLAFSAYRIVQGI